MIYSIISNQVIWLGLGSILLIVSILQKIRVSVQSRGVHPRIQNSLLFIGISCLTIFLSLVSIQGVTFYQITSIINFWIIIIAIIAYIIWGSAFIVVGGYLLILFRNVFSAFGLINIPNPMAALTNFGAPVAVGVIVGLWLFELIKFRKSSKGSCLPKIWGIRTLIITSMIILLASPFYHVSKVHVLHVMEIYWFIAFIPFYATSDIRKVERITRSIIVISLVLQVALFAHQILTRPLMIMPSLKLYSASNVDNIFRLGGYTGGANNTSLTLLTLIPFGLALIWKSSFTTLMRVPILVSLTYLIYRTDTRTTWIGFIIVLFIFFLLIKKKKYIVFISIISIIGVMTLPYISSKLVGNILQTGGITSVENNLGIRISMWNFAVRSSLTSIESWAFGVGWGFEPVPWSSFGTSGNWYTLHSLWIASIVHGGLILLFGWILFFWKGLKNTWISFKRANEEYKIWLAAGVASWIGFFFFTTTANADWPQPTQMIAIITLNLWVTAKLSLQANMCDVTDSDSTKRIELNSEIHIK